MKTVNEAVLDFQEKKAGIINRISAKYAQSLLLPGEDVTSAVVANIKTRRDKFPGVVVITNQRILAVCGLLGIKRSVIIPFDKLEHCEETATVMSYKAVFRSHKDLFAMTIDPDLGKKFSACVATFNGEDLETIKLDVDGNILNPNFVQMKRNNKELKLRNKLRNDAKEVELQKEAASKFDS